MVMLLLDSDGIILAGQHEVLASGPIEDLIAHREHRCVPLLLTLQLNLNILC